MGTLYYALFLFFLLYFINLLFVKFRNKKRKKERTEVQYLQNVYKLDMKKIDYKKLLKQIAFINSLLITLCFILITIVESFYIKIILATLLLIPFIFISYSILGWYYKKKGKVKK